MKYFYDTEFLEDGRTIDLISIGIVADDGRTYYAINDATTRGRFWFSRLFGKGSLNRRIRKHDWLPENVVPHLPQAHGDYRNHMPASWLFNYRSPEVKPIQQIADEVREFLLEGDSVPELWAYYGAYDHVRLAWLWGPMMNLPQGLPMYTNDIMQEAHRLGVKEMLPEQEAGQHNALADARHVQVMHQWLGEQS